MPPKHELTYIFGSKVSECQSLTKGFGLRVRLEKLTDLGRTFTVPSGEARKIGGYSNPGMLNLSRHFGVLVIKNAFVNREPSARVTSQSTNGFLLQDLWHWDSSLRGYGTILHNPSHQTRKAPTFYAGTEDVRSAFRGLDIRRMRLSEASAYALRKMCDSGFRFSVDGSEHVLRRYLSQAYPNLTQKIADRIPHDRLYSHVWTSEIAQVVVHCNDQPLGLLHARPKSRDEDNVLQAIILYP